MTARRSFQRYVFSKVPQYLTVQNKLFLSGTIPFENRGKAPKCQQLSGNYFANKLFPCGNRILPEEEIKKGEGSEKHLIRTESDRRERHRGFFIQHGPDRFGNVFEIKRLGQGGADSAALDAFFLQIKTVTGA